LHARQGETQALDLPPAVHQAAGPILRIAVSKDLLLLADRDLHSPRKIPPDGL
jgi:hypothetical protein